MEFGYRQLEIEIGDWRFKIGIEMEIEYNIGDLGLEVGDRVLEIGDWEFTIQVEKEIEYNIGN